MVVTDYTAAIAALNEAIAAGVQSVSYEGKMTTFRSFDEMLKTRAYLEREQTRANGQKVSTVGLGSFGRGYRTRGPFL